MSNCVLRITGWGFNESFLKVINKYVKYINAVGLSRLAKTDIRNRSLDKNDLNEVDHIQTGFMHMQKQRRRSAAQKLRS